MVHKKILKYRLVHNDVVEEEEDAEEVHMPVPKIHRSIMAREAEAEGVLKIVGVVVVTEKAQLVVAGMRRRRAKHLYHRPQEILRLLQLSRNRTYNNRTRRILMPKSASFVPRQSNIQQSLLVAIEHVISVQFE